MPFQKSKSTVQNNPSGKLPNKGSQAEEQALHFLSTTSKGLFRLLERNYRCRFGEIDLIGWDDAVLIFVEVRMRASQHFGGAVASITLAKQKRIVLTAQHYIALQGKHLQKAECRFDVIAIDGSNMEQLARLNKAYDASCIESI